MSTPPPHSRSCRTALALILLLSCLLSACLDTAAEDASTTEPPTIETPAPPSVPALVGTDSTPAAPEEEEEGDTTDDEATPDTPEAPDTPAARKYNPGHYIAMNGFDGQSAMLLAVQPGVRGIHKRYLWKDLEPALGTYDFSAIAADLQLMADHGMQLVVMIEDKTFTDTRPTPPYLWEAHTLPNSGGGYTAKRWDPYVIERLSRLIDQLGSRFDEHPNLEGMALQETALSLAQGVKTAHGYTPEAYRDALISVLLNARAALPGSQVFWYMNFLDERQAYIGEIAAAAAAADIAMGGPDVLPDSWPLQRHAYPYYAAFKDRMTLFGAMQYDSYAHRHTAAGDGAPGAYPGTYWSMTELFLFARDQLHVNYLFWTRKPRPNPADSYDWHDVLAVIREQPSFN